jgi:Glycosyl transferase family 2
MIKSLISIILCTHNPRAEYLNRVLTALQSQTLSLQTWELLLIDNASQNVLSTQVDLTWHPHARHIREEQLGLTPARLRGIKEATSAILIFVDDDNVLNANYLEIALKISQDLPHIGAWGGQIQAEFEVPPPDWATPYLGFLAIREFEQDKWSNLLHQHESTPCGAGLCVRKAIAEKYADLVCHDPKRLNLDRKGKSLASCGDSDLAFTACDMGWGTGQFTALRLTHLISASRVTTDYLLRLIEGITYSLIILDSLRGKLPEFEQPSPIRRGLRQLYRLWKYTPIERRVKQAIDNGKALAIQELF